MAAVRSEVPAYMWTPSLTRVVGVRGGAGVPKGRERGQTSFADVDSSLSLCAKKDSQPRVDKFRIRFLRCASVTLVERDMAASVFRIHGRPVLARIVSHILGRVPLASAGPL